MIEVITNTKAWHRRLKILFPFLAIPHCHLGIYFPSSPFRHRDDFDPDLINIFGPIASTLSANNKFLDIEAKWDYLDGIRFKFEHDAVLCKLRFG